jgi:glycosyltransferase involved in cell wall biosynthesis
VGLIINAPNVHLGGGLSLLSAILRALGENFEGFLILDERVQLPKGFPGDLIVYRIHPSIWGRLRSEWYLRKWTGTDDSVLCFGNLPPFFKLRGKVFVFLQNRYQIESRSLKGFPFSTLLRIRLERLWFSWGKRNITHFIVQTPTMQRTVQRVLGMPSIVLPFSENPKRYKRVMDTPCDRMEAKKGFVYVASGEPHKNHRNLMEAWTLLAKEGITPGLRLTLDKDRFFDLCVWIEDKIRELGLNVTNVGNISAQDLERIYNESLALIYPSDFESFGLPLIEARCAGIAILASERDFVRDAVDPEETFDPHSPVSIARAVKRFMGIPEQPLPITDAKDYLARIIEMAQA